MKNIIVPITMHHNYGHSGSVPLSGLLITFIVIYYICIFFMALFGVKEVFESKKVFYRCCLPFGAFYYMFKHIFNQLKDLD